MYSAWGIPQNIQKRVFLYILQQLSLFSGIELPNLEEVSFNNIHLRDVAIDPEKITQIPGFRLRHGNLRSVALKGSVKDGAHLEIEGVDLVLVPKIDNLRQDIENAQASLAQSSADLTSTILLDPSESSAAGSRDFPAEPSPHSALKTDQSAPIESQAAPSSSSTASPSGTPGKSAANPAAGPPKKSTASTSLGGVMSKAIDLALSKLQVRVSDITVKILVEPADLLLHIDEAVFSYKTGVKILRITGVTVSVGKPFSDSKFKGRTSAANPGGSGQSGESTNDDASEKNRDSESESESKSESESESESESDGDIDEEAEASLTDSMVFTHEEASSIYMSATSQTFAGSQKKEIPSTEPVSPPVPLLFIDCVDVSFQNVSPLSNVKVDIHTVNVAAVPLLPTVSLVLNSLSKLFKLSIHQLRKRNALTKPNSRPNSRGFNYDSSGSELGEEDDNDNVNDNDTKNGEDNGDKRSELSPGASVLKKFHIKRLEISLTSALDESGKFASYEDEVNIVLANLTMKLKDENLTYGGLETFEILRYLHGEKSHVFHFDVMKKSSPSPAQSEEPSAAANSADSKKADIRFEYSRFLNQRKTLASELTILVSRPGILDLDASSLKYLINFSLWLSATSENLAALLKNVEKFNEISDSRSAASPKLSTTSNASSQVILQTASFDAQLRVSNSCVFKAFIFPISFDKMEDLFTIPRINLDILKGGLESNIFTISDIHLRLLPTKFNSFHYSSVNSSPRKYSSKSSASLSVRHVNGNISLSLLTELLDASKHFSKTFQHADNINCLEAIFINETGPEKSHLAQTNTLMNSIYSSQNRYKRINNAQIMFGESPNPTFSMRVTVNTVVLTLSEISDVFGGLELKAEGIEVLRPKNGMSGHVSALHVKRTSAVSEFLINHNSGFTSEYPMIQFRKKSDDKSVFELVCRSFLVDYYVNWLKLLQSPKESVKSSPSKSTKDPNSSGELDIRIAYHDFALGLVPGRLDTKLYLTVATGNSDISLNADQFSIKSSFRDLKLLLIDDVRAIRHDKFNSSTSTVYFKLIEAGFVDIGQINLVHVGLTFILDIDSMKLKRSTFTDEWSLISVKINIDNSCIDLCGDSSHTLLQTLSDLKEPVIFKDEEKFRVRVGEDFVFPSEIFDNFVLDEREGSHKNVTGHSDTQKHSDTNRDDFFFIDEYYGEAKVKEDDFHSQLSNVDLNRSSSDSKEGSSLRLVESHFIEKEHPNTENVLPFSLDVNLKRAELFMYDGFDWKSTRKSIKGAVHSLGKRAAELEENDIRKRPLHEQRDHNDSDLEDEQSKYKLTQTLFQSIHIETDQNVGASTLVEIINSQVRGGDTPQENHGEAHTNVKVDKSFKDLKLKRSRAHKVSAECRNLEVKVKGFLKDDIVSEPLSKVSESKVVNSVGICLDSIEVKDNVQTSTWNRMLTYMKSLGEREIGTNMLELSIENVRPDCRMPFTEAVISLRVLPLRLFIDQDTLGFITRFFGFKDTRFALPVDEIIYIQKLTVEPLRVKFDYKPKSIDYAGIRSGNNAELANFFILDGSDLKLKKAIVYGAHGFPKVGKALGQIYGPYIQKHQLSGLLSGLSPVKSILNVGNGVRDLVALPIQEYKRDGRVMYGLQKGSISFAKTTTNEILRLGVKLASGAQVVLENSEEYFGGEGASARGHRKKPQKAKKTQAPKSEGRRNLLESSQMLKSSVVVDHDQLSKPMSYIQSAIDEEDSEPEMGPPQSSILVLEGTSDEDDHEELLSEDTEKKVTSLYSNQPANAKEGLKSAFKALGKNLSGSKKKIRELKRELRNADSIQEQIASVAKSSPVIVIRPLIGGTEAMMKTLIGISNGIDSRSLQESHDKYRIDKD